MSKKFPFYPDRVRKNLRPLIERQGFAFTRGLASCTMSQLYKIEKGQSGITINKLQAIADEIGCDLLDFFNPLPPSRKLG
jgi:transcriptional regulator with XRE-family HTH domain